MRKKAPRRTGSAGLSTERLRVKFTVWPALIAIAAVFGCQPAATPKPTPPPPSGPPQNLVLILIDTLRQDHLSAYGYHRGTTPVMDRLAAEGARLDGVSPTSWTKPATASILTGLHPLRHQAYGREDLLPEDVVTLAEMMSDRGMFTMGLSANLHITKKWGFAQGFDEYRNASQFGYGNVADCGDVNDALLTMLDNITEPYFLYLHYVDPHVPYDPPHDWEGRPLSKHLQSVSPMDNDHLSPLGFFRRDPQLVRDAVDLYDGEVRDIDSRIGELIEELESRNLMSSTLTVITSDHGEEFEDHGRMGHGHTLYREQTSVPLIVHAPGFVPAGTVMGNTSLMDIVPTALELIGHPIPENLDGRSIATELIGGDGASPPDRSFLIHLDYETGNGLGLETEDRKVMVGRSPYHKSLFDLKSDPGELNPIPIDSENASDFTELATTMTERHNELQRQAVTRQTQSVDSETAANLAALGYVDTEEVGFERSIPDILEIPDQIPGGQIGWERGESSCIETGLGRPGSNQLLLGWHLPNSETGRWSWPDATLVLRVPEDPEGVMTLSGINHRVDSPNLDVGWDQTTILNQQVKRGSFSIKAELSGVVETGDLVLIRLHIDPPFVPSDHDRPDHRTLGLFFTEVCIR